MEKEIIKICKKEIRKPYSNESQQLAIMNYLNLIDRDKRYDWEYSGED